MLKKYYFLMMAACCLMGIMPAYADTLCPDLQTESSVVPSDLARVQEDIDRLSLCVERTKLLQQLNELSNKPNTDVVQPLSAGAIDPSFLKPVTANSIKSMGSTDLKEKPFENMADWVIRRVWGQGGELQAQLMNVDGVLVTAKVEEELIDGSIVKQISVRGVKIERKNGREEQLGWQEESKDGAL